MYQCICILTEDSENDKWVEQKLNDIPNKESMERCDVTRTSHLVTSQLN